MLDLDGDGVVRTLGTDAGVHFDHDGNGFKELTGWAGYGDGMLMLDRDADGSLDNGSELFGDFTPLANGMLAVNGFQALAQFDTNGDGKIDASDSIWSQLKVWQHDPEATDMGDPDSSGMMKTLDEIGIKAIYLESTITNRTDESGNTETRTGNFEWTDGRQNAISEYRLQRDTSDAIAREYLEVPSDIAALPQLYGYGNVYDLHQAMERERLAGTDTLKSLVEQFTATTDVTIRNSLMEQIIYKWTGADTVAPNARGPFMDGRQVVALEKLYGDSPQNPDEGLATAWKQTYHEISEIFYSSMMMQTHLKDLFGAINHYFDENTMSMRCDFSAVITEIQNGLANEPEKGKQDLSEFARTVRGLGRQGTIDYLSFRETFITQDPSLSWVIDTGGLPVVSNIYAHTWGTDDSEAITRHPLADDIINGRAGNDVIYGTDKDERILKEGGSATVVAGKGNDILKKAA